VYNLPSANGVEKDKKKGREFPMKPTVTQGLEVRYGDLDPYGHVNNAVYLEFFEGLRVAYWRALAASVGIMELVAGDIPGARYVIAETTVRYKAPLFLDDAPLGAATIRTVGNRSFTMNFELRRGGDGSETFQDALLIAEGSASHVFFDPVEATVMPRPDWFLPAVAALEDRPEESFSKE
jgi:acyl-CoA thioester hydrolase